MGMYVSDVATLVPSNSMPCKTNEVWRPRQESNLRPTVQETEKSHWLHTSFRKFSVMWHAIFDLHPSVLEKVLRPLIIYGFLLIALRLTGHRELGQSNALQFALLLSIANAVQNGMIGADDSITGALIGAITLFVAHGMVELIASRNRWFHRAVIGQSIVLVSDGKVNSRALKRQRLNEDDLVSATQGANSIADIDRAVVTVNGEIVVTLHKEFELRQQIDALNLRLDQLLANRP